MWAIFIAYYFGIKSSNLEVRIFPKLHDYREVLAYFTTGSGVLLVGDMIWYHSNITIINTITVKDRELAQVLDNLFNA